MKQITYTADGATTAFNFNFPFFSANDIKVSLNGILKTASDFTLVSTAAPGYAEIPYSGGTITLATAPASGTTVKIWRDIQPARHTDFQPTAELQPHLLNQEFNKVIEELKQQNESISNVLSLSNVPSLADLTAELTAIRAALNTFLTAADLLTLGNTVDTHTSTLATLGGTVDGHTASIATLNGYDYVKESQAPSADNSYTWYRKYKSGWVEQGGLKIVNTSVYNLPIEMANTSYTVIASPKDNYGVTIQAKPTSATRVTITAQTGNGTTFDNFSGTWLVAGMSASAQ